MVHGSKRPQRSDDPASFNLSSGTKPFRRRPVRGLWTDVHVENVPANVEVSEHHHDRWQIFTSFARATYDVTWCEPSGKIVKWTISAGEVFILPGGWRHSVRWREPADGIWLYVDDDWVCQQFPDLPSEASVKAFSSYVVEQPMIADLCLELREFAAVANGVSDWHVAAAGSHLAVILLETHQALRGRVLTPLTGVATTIVERMTAHVEMGQCGRAPVGRIARSLGISPRHLSRLFVQATGRSPRDWILRKKAEEARALLQAGKGIEETVEEVGFADPSHLNRVLKGIFGMTAAKLRAAGVNGKSSGGVRPV